MKLTALIITAFTLLIAVLPNQNIKAAPAAAQSAAYKIAKAQSLDLTRFGVNAFANDPQFGSVASQLSEVKNTLKLNFIRVLFAWNDAVQSSPTAAVNFSFYDDIARSIPPGVDALVVVTGIPSWMQNPQNWSGGDPRATFVERWVKKVAARYKTNSRIIGYEIWNEPNMTANTDNVTLSLDSSPDNYFGMLSKARAVIKRISPKKMVVNAATTAIDQGYPKALRYNKRLRDLGARSLVDAWAIHYYGSHLENVFRPGGIQSFLNGLGKPIWVTEIGAKGINKQKSYAQTMLPILQAAIPQIKRFYWYQFTENTPADSTYGLKNPTSGFTISDLYIYLRDFSRTRRR